MSGGLRFAFCSLFCFVCFVVCPLLMFVWCWLRVVCWTVIFIRCLLFVACCVCGLLFVECSVLFIVSFDVCGRR